MPQCAVATCRNSHRRTRGRRIRYHRFPQIPEVRSRWVRACGRVPLSNGEIPFNIQTARICSLHFNNESYEKDIEHLVLGLPARSRLRRGAVPTLGVPVNVQPVTKMLVEDAKRSLLKVAHAQIITDRKITNGNAASYADDTSTRSYEGDEADDQQQQQQQQQSVNEESSMRYLYNGQDPRDHNRQQQRKSSVDNVDSQKMDDIDVLLAVGLKPASRLNKMHAAVEYGSGGTSGKKVETTEKREEDARGSPKVPQSRQNGAALPEETATAIATSGIAAERLRPNAKRDNMSDADSEQQSMPIDGARPGRGPVDEVAAAGSRNSTKKTVTGGRTSKGEREHTRKRRSADDSYGNPLAKKVCFEQRERYIDTLVGTTDRVTAEDLASRSDELRSEVQALDELARAKEVEWNEILSMRKLKEEAYLRIERRRQVISYMESNGQLPANLPPASLLLITEWDTRTVANNPREGTLDTSTNRDGNDGGQTCMIVTTENCQPRVEERTRPSSPQLTRRERTQGVIGKSLNHGQRRTNSPKQVGENGRKPQQRQQQQQLLLPQPPQQLLLPQPTQQPQQPQQQQQQQHLFQQVGPQIVDNRQIGEGRQGPIVDVRSLIADHRLRNPEAVPRRYDKREIRPRVTPVATAASTTTATTTTTTTTGLINVRRGRRMRNSVNIGLGAGGAMVETGHNVDSRPSSTDSCKSNTNTSGDPNNSMSYKDVLVQFAKLSQQQGEPVKTPQNYPDVTLHPVAPSPIVQNATTTQQSSGSLLHGILTKSQSPRPTFSPTLARLLTAPERERNNSPTITATPQQNTQTQHLLQTYQGSNVSITDLLSSSKARTEITITPVVNPVTPIHTTLGNNLVHVDDAEEDGAMIDESRLISGSRDNRDERDSPPRCQGCQERAAQFVCAGCGNQWYCSRDCQVAAWDEHSEVCSG